MSTLTPTDLGNLKTDAWRAIRKVARTAATAADVQAAEDAMRATEAACEAYRAEHYPAATRLFVLADADLEQPVSVYAVYPTGPECVHDEARGVR